MEVKGDPGLDTLAKIGNEYTQQSSNEQEQQRNLLEIAKYLLPRYGHQWNVHSLVSMKRQTISRILHYNDLYQKIVSVPGVICEFGVQWGSTMAQLINLRGIYEPYNHSRKIFGFDTFEGFSDLDVKDGGHSSIGDYATISGYEQLLERVLLIQESFSPISHMKKFELIRGDATVTIDGWLAQNPHAIISMAIFDMDVYKPTKVVLEKIIPRLTKGSLLVFDELNCPYFPGETSAVNEVLGLNNLALRRNPGQPFSAWAVYGD